jgi:hypothetical protein
MRCAGDRRAARTISISIPPEWPASACQTAGIAAESAQLGHF